MKKSTVAFAALNIFGMVWLGRFVVHARDFAMMEGRNYYEFGDSLNFLLFVVPVLFLCLVADIVWLILAGFEIYRRRSYWSAAACFVIVIMWGVVIQVDRGLASLPSSQAALTPN